MLRIGGVHAGIRLTGNAGGSSDPLADFPFLLRLQTHLPGSNAPLGLYQDTGCTVPSTQDGDPIAAWRDELSGNGVVLSQSDTQKQPILVFVNGVPTVLPDGIDDVLLVNAPMLAQPFTSIVQCDWEGAPTVYGVVLDSGAVGFTYIAKNSFGNIDLFAGSLLSSASAIPANVVVSAKFNGGSSQAWINGVSQVTGDAGTNATNGFRVGGAENNSAFFTGPITCVLVGAITDAQRIISENYASSLTP